MTSRATPPGALPSGADGGPQGRTRRGSRGGRQPQRPIPAAQHGDRAATTALQGAAPMAAAGGQPQPAGGGAPAGLPAPRDIFGSQTQRPNEPITAGAAVGPGRGNPNMLARDPDMLLRAIASRFPHPDLIALLGRRVNG